MYFIGKVLPWWNESPGIQTHCLCLSGHLLMLCLSSLLLLAFVNDIAVNITCRFLCGHMFLLLLGMYVGVGCQILW